MTNTIQIFENEEFGAIRTMSDEQGNPLLCGKDVAEALGYEEHHRYLTPQEMSVMEEYLEMPENKQKHTATSGNKEILMWRFSLVT